MTLTTGTETAASSHDSALFRLLDLSSELVHISTLDGRIRYVNRVWRETLGYGDADLKRMLILDVLDPQDAAAFADSVGTASATSKQQSFSTTLITHDGQPVPVDGRLECCETADGSALIYCAMTDMRSRQALTATADEAERQFMAVFNSQAIGMAIQELDGQWRAVNDALAHILGYAAGELVQMTFHEVTHPDDLDGNIEQLQRLLIGESSTFQMEKRYIHRDGSEMLAALTVTLVTDTNGNPLHFVSQVQDVTARREHETRLLHKATHDALTGLPNRDLFIDRLGHALARNQRDGGKVAVMFLDLDGFKDINDQFGHQQGDKCLIEIGRRLRASARAGDTISRHGGDEFTILLEQVSHPSIALEIAERVRSTLSYPILLEQTVTTITPSIGIAISDNPDDQAEQLLHDADAAMYAAKRAGKNRVVIARRER